MMPGAGVAQHRDRCLPAGGAERAARPRAASPGPRSSTSRAHRDDERDDHDRQDRAPPRASRRRRAAPGTAAGSRGPCRARARPSRAASGTSTKMPHSRRPRSGSRPAARSGRRPAAEIQAGASSARKMAAPSRAARRCKRERRGHERAVDERQRAELAGDRIPGLRARGSRSRTCRSRAARSRRTARSAISTVSSATASRERTAPTPCAKLDLLCASTRRPVACTSGTHPDGEPRALAARTLRRPPAAAARSQSGARSAARRSAPTTGTRRCAFASCASGSSSDEQPGEARDRIGVVARRIGDRDAEVGRHRPPRPRRPRVTARVDALTNSPAAFCTAPYAMLVLHGVDQLDVADGARRLLDQPGDALVALAAEPDRPVHRVAAPDLALPLGR